MAKKSLPICPFRWTTCYGYAEKKKGKSKPVCAWWIETHSCCAIILIALKGLSLKELGVIE